jgi:hypothetical protein
MKEYQYGNSKVIIHSPLALMSKKEQKEWFQQEWENKNPILKAIVEVAVSCERDSNTK